MNDQNLEGHYAGFLSRALGLLLDYVIVLASVSVVVVVSSLLLSGVGINPVTCTREVTTKLGLLACAGGQLFIAGILLLTGPLYFVLFWMLVGQTIGQRVVGVSVVRFDGRRPGFGRSLLRWIGYQICLATLGIGFLWVLVDDRRMGWHDKLSRTLVIYSWPAVQNERFIGKVSRRLRRGRSEPASAREGEVVEPAPALPAGSAEG